MLNETYTLGVTPNNLVYTKLFADANNSAYSVSGLTPNTAREMSVKHETSGSGQVRTVIDLTEKDEIGVAPSTKVETSRVYLVIQRAPSKSAVSVKAALSRLKTLVDDTAFQDKLLNREV